MIALGIIIILVGLWFFLSALLNWEWFYAIVEYAAIEALFGDGAARWVCGIVGLTIMGLGIATLLGR